MKLRNVKTCTEQRDCAKNTTSVGGDPTTLGMSKTGKIPIETKLVKEIVGGKQLTQRRRVKRIVDGS